MTKPEARPLNRPPTPLVLTERFARRTTQDLARNLEAVGLLVQAIVVTNTALLEKTRPGGTRILLLLALLHLFLAGAAYRKGGIFPLGGMWATIYLAGIVLMSFAVADVLPPGVYGSESACAQLCGYSGPPIALFAFYPWISIRRDFLRPGVQLIVVGVAVLTPLAVMFVTHGYLTGTNVASAGISASLTATSYGIGKALGALCRSAARAQLDALREEYERIFRYLHGRVETSLAVVRAQFNEPGRDGPDQALDDLAEAVNHERAALLLAQPNVSVAQLLNLHARRVTRAIKVAALPRVGGVTLSRDIALVLDDVLGDLLKNTVVHGAETVWIELEIGHNLCTLVVVDDGPGFAAEQFEDAANSIHWLRHRVRDHQGDLRLLPRSADRTTVRLTLPLELDRSQTQRGDRP
ncbi:hypothetical protein I6A60_11395 [Frankia sp. AgB1.9]|uniref:hypothetical protein n=1 Tax=unclassified Frankia TaxID=2632575 RepID=UPI00193265CA|nr:MULTISPECIES: hypothetical protein [unclassified Frankia]MBL7490362.1 hypothetical protein [Frankia sp. AgW1.1]MBL7548472.1 hypothetical protein [Frankia sp. AgB1.9]MBL7621362.1 hypothetical protein [Frankia sp. AgB1.8]